jgi:hypothetical protein
MTNFERFVRNVTSEFNNHFEGKGDFAQLAPLEEGQFLLIAAAVMLLQGIAAPDFAWRIIENLDHADEYASPEICASAALSEARL